MSENEIYRVNRVSDQLLDCCFAMFDGFGWGEEDKFSFAQLIQFDVNDMNGVMFVASKNRQPVGFIKGMPTTLPSYVDSFPRDTKSMYIDWMCVHPAARQTGVGKSLLNAYSDYAKSQNMDVLFLRSLPNKVAKEFWKARGFQTIGWNLLMGKQL